jgi:serine/threonine protein kinase
MPVDPQRLKELFLAAAGLPSAAERAALLDRECGADAELRQRVQALLQAHDDSGGFLARPAGQSGLTADCAPQEPEAVGTSVGPYTLLQQLGEGGMGTVWVAEQHQPVKRRVALKLIKPGMDSAQVLRRFAAERQALALMDHTNIAKVFDAGTTA